MTWPTDVMSVGQVNDEDVPLDTIVNMRLSRDCGLVVQQRLLLTLQGFDELNKNEKDELFKSIHLILKRAEAEGEEGSYEDHLSCLEELQE
jgi:hypothetical protein